MLLSTKLQEQKRQNQHLHSITSGQSQQHHWDQIPETNKKCHFHLKIVKLKAANE